MTTRYLCPECGGCLVGPGLVCSLCGAEWGESDYEPPCPRCGSYEHVGECGECCPVCGVDMGEFYGYLAALEVAQP